MIVRILRPLLLIVLGTVLLGGVYPLCVAGLGRLIFPYEAKGSLLEFDDLKRGSRLIGQSFTSDGYLHPRPSAAEYNGADSAGSNLSFVEKDFRTLLEKRASAYKQLNKIPEETQVPIDAVTASGSGLDPEISLENALLQAPRIAKARKLSERQVRAIIRDIASRSLLEKLTLRRVNVLECNMAIEQFHRYVLYGLSEIPQEK